MIESVHLLALSVIGGAVLIVDLRLLGFGIRSQTLAEVARDAQPWFLGSWSVMIVTGVLLFWSEPQKLYYSTPFSVKMICLLLGTIFALTVRRKVTLAGEGRVLAVGDEAGRARVADAVVRRRRRRPLDRVFGLIM